MTKIIDPRVADEVTLADASNDRLISKQQVDQQFMGIGSPIEPIVLDTVELWSILNANIGSNLVEGQYVQKTRTEVEALGITGLPLSYSHHVYFECIHDIQNVPHSWDVYYSMELGSIGGLYVWNPDTDLWDIIHPVSAVPPYPVVQGIIPSTNFIPMDFASPTAGGKKTAYIGLVADAGGQASVSLDIDIGFADVKYLLPNIVTCDDEDYRLLSHTWAAT